MDRAYAWLTVKSVDVARRTFTGIASTPTPDRSGDVLDPLGVTFKNPLPLLLHHDKKSPVGRVVFDPPTKDGITFSAEIPVIAEAGVVKERTDEAWHSIQSGLLSALSVGFRVLRDGAERIKEGGLFLRRVEVCELSLVTVPANVDATILTIKSLDAPHLAAFGLHPLGVSSLPVVRAHKGAPVMTKQTVTEQITAYELTRKNKSDRMAELMDKAAADHVTLDADQSKEYDDLSSEVASVDVHLERLRAHEKQQLATATPVVPTHGTKDAIIRTATPVITVKSNVEPGTGFTRYAQAMLATRGNPMLAAEYAKRWDSETPEVSLALKAAVAAGTTTDATWAGPLSPLRPLANEFMALLRPATILGKIPGLRRVPFNVSVPIQTGGGTYKWVGQGAAKPVGKLAFGTITLVITKCAGIIVITDELARNSSPAAESVIRADMIAGIAQFLDIEFTDPAKAPVANVSPGSITNGVTPVTTAGTTPANARTDIQALINAMTVAGISTAGAVLLMSETNAAALGAALNPLGQDLFPDVSVNGGSAMGVQVLPSQAVGNNVILLQPSTVLYADDGGVTIDVSMEASVQMDDAPAPADATTVFTSLWQNNLVGLRAERYVNWKRGRTGGVQYTVATYAA
jgi:HK97 family phage major capsid protein/HK97 family phage prohead protease